MKYESYIFQEGLVDGFCTYTVNPQTVLCALLIFESLRISQIHPKPLQMYFRESIPGPTEMVGVPTEGSVEYMSADIDAGQAFDGRTEEYAVTHIRYS